MKPDWRILLSAFLIVFAFPPWDFAFLIWFALVPWFLLLHSIATPKAAVKQGLWLCFLMSLGGFYWVASVLYTFGGLPWPLAIVGLLLFCLIGQPQFLLLGWLYTRYLNPLKRGETERAAPTISQTFLFSFLYTGLDWFIPKLFMDTLGHSLYEAVWLRQLADIGGVPLLTFLIIFTNMALAGAVLRIRQRKEPSVWPATKASAPLLLIVLFFLSGALTYGKVRNEEISEILAKPVSTPYLAVIQANIGDFDKIAAERGYRGAADRVVETYVSLSDEALNLSPKPQALIWPETSYPSTFRTPMNSDEFARDQRLERYVDLRGVPLLFGGYDQKEGKDYNAFFYLSPDKLLNQERSNDLSVYHKNILLLFGEYIPGAEQIPFLKEQFPQVGNFGRGPGPVILPIPLDPEVTGLEELKTSPVICYEVLFSRYVLEGAKKGSQLILNITNDSWFGENAEPYLHLALSTFRSVETRIPMLRATNTGISAVVLPTGEIKNPTAIFEPAILNAGIPVTEPIWTLLKVWGDWFGPTSLVLGSLWFFGVRVLPRRRRRVSPK